MLLNRIVYYSLFFGRNIWTILFNIVSKTWLILNGYKINTVVAIIRKLYFN